LHAKVSGYVDKITVDIGDQVKAGQLLAKLEVPELKDELNRATAVQKRAEAITKTRTWFTRVYSRWKRSIPI
jgi:multidrug efflux pump subunit AcrA (membrane-fusion protein)